MSSYVSSPESLDALGAAIASGLSLFEPPPPLALDEWADQYARLPRESSAKPGQWITATAEYQRGIMRAITDPDIERVVLMMPAQSGKSAILLNAIGYFTHWDPAPMLMLQPTLEMAEAFSKDRIAPMIRDTPVLTKLFGDPRSRDSGNTLLHKEFSGGQISLAGANSPASLASRPKRIFFGDEVDRFPASAGTEGDPVKLAQARLTTFWNKKTVLTSTPTIKGASRIEAELFKSDMREFRVPCPQCGEMQPLVFSQLRWPSPKTGASEHRPDECYYVCVNGCEITETDKPDMVRAGDWFATKQSIDGKTAGFSMESLPSPWVTWPDLIRWFLEAKKSPEELKTFVNTRLAQTWEVQGDRIEKEVFKDRMHEYMADVPAGALVLTAGVDVQGDRLEATVIGWGVGEESWAIEHRIFDGDPAKTKVWEELDDWLKTEYTHENGAKLRIRCTMIDSGGHHTKQVYAFTKPREFRRIYSCIGRAGWQRPLLARPTKGNDAGALLYKIGTDVAKESFHARLKIEEEGPGYCHFPCTDKGDYTRGFDAEYFAQVSAEQLVTETKAGVPVRLWKKRRDRNEALDLRVYAMGALERLRPNYGRLKKNIDALSVEAKQLDRPELPPDPAPQTTSNFRALRRRRGWVNSWRQ